ncbi:hypothetical protein FHU38_002816 [Saccharomonospora amisosensis]|uniref:Uncharacterized protein n=1 Tax=Saccharomonospora amisosensis TaxID=1128677 RepID=A0A7X5URC9_9PSEU|nr:hypothetical protein [Saccharomonospora amisosensis]NIJ12472.1 hypothetical protein [Saccharomonospora amisosensis]
MKTNTAPDVVLDWRIPATPRGVSGALRRFLGPGRTRSENVAEVAGQLVGMSLLSAYLATTGGWSERSPLQLAVLAVMVFDLVGGVLTNATNPAKRWYHRPGHGSGRRLLFVASHLLYLVAIPLVLHAGGWTWFAVNAALLLSAAVLIEALPVELKRVSAVGLYLVAVLVNLTWLPLPESLAWFGFLFYLKLLVCFLVPEAPMVSGRRPLPGKEVRP